MKKWIVAGAMAAATMGGVVVPVQRAEACGCFTPPDPSVPVVQAGERILFSADNGQITAHIQIQYSGNAAEFGWLLPLPAVPQLELGVDELFNQLTAQTQPKYRLKRVYEGNCSFDPSRFGGLAGGGAGAPSANAGEGDATGGSPLVIQDSIGPYDYAVLKADSKQAMLDWLAANRYFVPAGTDGAVGPYIRPGGYFLALKLRSGKSVGDLQPVVLHYASDLPMIPIVLTSVAAQPDMGIQVWMLGKGRAIPRNYYHTVIDDAVIDWFTSGANYNDVIIKATKEAEGRHTFVTEFAGASTVMQNILNAPGRFGDPAVLATMPDAPSFAEYLFANGYATQSQQSGGGGPVFVQQQLSGQLLTILGRYIPVPPAILNKGYTASQFYAQLRYFLTTYQQQYPGDFAGWTMNYQPAQMANDIDTVVVKPTLAAGALFSQQPYLTRLYTTLSPEQMDRDPVFSYNATLPDWANVHEGTLTYHCGFWGRDNQQTTPATLVTASGWTLEFPYGVGQSYTPNAALPGSQQIQVLSEEGGPQVVTDNTGLIRDTLHSSAGGCGVNPGARATDAAGGLLALGLASLAAVYVARRRRAAAVRE